MQSVVRLGCQTFTWEMEKEKWLGKLPDILASISQAGYSGVEVSDVMLGLFRSEPRQFQNLLESVDLTPISIAFSCESGMTVKSRLVEDVEIGQRWVEFSKECGCDTVSIGSPTNYENYDSEIAFSTAAEVCNRIGEFGRSLDITVCLHPSSHQSTLLPGHTEYRRIFRLLDPELLKFTPDTGHIINGGGSVRTTMEEFIDRVLYVHVKDVSSDGAEWRMLGHGACDIREVVELAASAPNFNGWIVLEEESDIARLDPVSAIKTNYRTARSILDQMFGNDVVG